MLDGPLACRDLSELSADAVLRFIEERTTPKESPSRRRPSAITRDFFVAPGVRHEGDDLCPPTCAIQPDGSLPSHLP